MTKNFGNKNMNNKNKNSKKNFFNKDEIGEKKNFNFKENNKYLFPNNKKIKNDNINKNYSKNNKNNKFQSNINNKNLNSYSFFENKIDSIFGNGSFKKLILMQKQLKNNQFIRINESKIKKNDVVEFLEKNRIKFSNTFLDNCIKIEKSFFSISSSYLFLRGDIYLQDLASQVVINSINFDVLKKKGEIIQILDMCSSPGSKTTQLCDKLEILKIPYEIIALEPQEKRIQKLINNLQKQNCKDVKIIQCEAQNFKFNSKFDLILIDAPCSGNLIGDNNWLKKRDQNGIELNSKLQKEILKNANLLAKKNSQIIYSTCSLEIEENELNVEFAIDKLKLKVKNIDVKIPFNTNPILKYKSKNLNQEISKALRFMPYESKTEGFFICKFEK